MLVVLRQYVGGGGGRREGNKGRRRTEVGSHWMERALELDISRSRVEHEFCSKHKKSLWGVYANTKFFLVFLGFFCELGKRRGLKNWS